MQNSFEYDHKEIVIDKSTSYFNFVPRMCRRAAVDIELILKYFGFIGVEDDIRDFETDSYISEICRLCYFYRKNTVVFHIRLIGWNRKSAACFVEQVRGIFRKADFIKRLSYDEIVVCVPLIAESEDLRALISRIKKRFSTLAVLLGDEIAIGAAIYGIHGEDGAALINSARANPTFCTPFRSQNSNADRMEIEGFMKGNKLTSHFSNNLNSFD